MVFSELIKISVLSSYILSLFSIIQLLSERQELIFFKCVMWLRFMILESCISTNCALYRLISMVHCVVSLMMLILMQKENIQWLILPVKMHKTGNIVSLASKSSLTLYKYHDHWQYLYWFKPKAQGKSVQKIHWNTNVLSLYCSKLL